jgi:hypothetical protein
MTYAKSAIAFPRLELDDAADADVGKIEITQDLLEESLDRAEELDAEDPNAPLEHHVEAAPLSASREDSWAPIVESN